ncbi:hypothetical protein OG809_38075 [Kribbella soli]
MPREDLRAERVLGVEVGRGEVQPPPARHLGRQGQHLRGVGDADARVDDQDGIGAADDADVRHEVDLLVRDHEQVGRELQGVRNADGGVGQ